MPKLLSLATVTSPRYSSTSSLPVSMPISSVRPSGVYTIEAKVISKPTGRDAQITYDGKTVLVDGHVPDRDPLKQAEAGAARIRDIIHERTGQDVAVRPIVLYPGWFNNQRCRSPRVWVQNENYLPGWLDHEPETLTESDVRRITAVLADYVRGRNSTS